eukprot:TRINITY_DN16289_c0_g1_i1.p1 TRINITY_DN16289_c0_g1~~TRINITY_DN16289_c0_g1_i1.p1  ORF type:complete len:1405 (-),score=263.54 TRINITY_DN16289_c0_g1_i1:49-4263(-)
MALEAPGARLRKVGDLDPYRVYSDNPKVASWRELRDPIWQTRYWNHVSSRVTTRSVTELVLLNGMEEFLVLGEWGLFVAVPEDSNAYEDLEWGLDILRSPNDTEAMVRLKRGSVVVSMGMPYPGIFEVLIPSDDEVVTVGFAKYRLPPNGGFRLMQRLPASEHNDDHASMPMVNEPDWTVLPIPRGMTLEAGGPTAVLAVTSGRDPRTNVIGYLNEGDVVRMAVIIGTRARLAEFVDGSRQELSGGWFSLVRLNAAPTLERVLEETDSMKTAAIFQAHLELMERLAEEEAEHEPEPRQPRVIGNTEPIFHVQAMHIDDPWYCAKLPLEFGEQRPTVTGGWRQIYDPIWEKLMFIEPISGCATWGLTDVMATGGMDDLLLARTWEICVVDPLAVEIMKDREWTLRIYSDLSLSGEPISRLTKGDFFIVMMFFPRLHCASILVPPAEEGGPFAVGYGRVRLNDGRPLTRSLLPPVEREAEGINAEPPEDDVLEGPFFSRPAGTATDNLVSTDQDLTSNAWARLPREYRISGYAEVLGMRARLPELEGGGWVSLFRADGAPNFWKMPTTPPTIDMGPKRKSSRRSVFPGGGGSAERNKGFVPACWPWFGVMKPPEEMWSEGTPSISSTAPPTPKERPLPTILEQIGGQRAACDWVRTPYFVKGEDCFAYKSPATFSTTTLHNLLRLGVWKPSVVDCEELPVREALPLDSKQVAVLPRGSIVVTEWMTPLGQVRILLPSMPDDPRPLHAWVDLGSISGTALLPMAAGGNYWIEPKGGHLSEKEQCDETGIVSHVVLQKSADVESEEVGQLIRGDGIQIAEVVGLRARVVQTRSSSRPSSSVDNGGWMNVFDEAGWSQFKRRFPGEVHQVELDLQRAMAELMMPGGDIFDPSRRASSTSALSRVGAAETPMPEPEASIESTSCAVVPQVAELPLLLQQIGELETASIMTRDWREHRDPVWGRRYFVNRWSGQIIHRLESMGVAQATVRLTIWMVNLSLPFLRLTFGADAPRRLKELESSMHDALVAMADVPDDRMEVHFEEGPGIAAGPPSTPGLPESGSASFRSSEDTIMGGSKKASSVAEVRKETEMEEGMGGPQIRIIATIKAPGVHAHWASAGIKRAMADGEKFALGMFGTVCSIPNIEFLREDTSGEPLGFLRADLEEFDMPRLPKHLEPPPPEEKLPPPPSKEAAELKRKMRYMRPKVLECPHLDFKGTSSHALAHGLKSALEEGPAHLLEIHLWSCNLGDEGAAALAGALASGVGVVLHTVLIDENKICALGACALGAGLASCKNMRELNVSRNPIESAGFQALLKGLGPEMAVLDASMASLDDASAKSLGKSLRRWPGTAAVKLGGNPAITAKGAEILTRSLLVLPALRCLDLRGATLGNEAPRLRRLAEAGGVEQTRLCI